MSVLDHAGRQRLTALQERGGAARFQEVPPTVGTDRETGLSLTVDAARRVSDVRVPDAGRVRTPAELRAAVRSAFQEADIARGRASRTRLGDQPPAGAEIDVSTLLGPSRPPRSGVVKASRALVESGLRTPAARSFVATGRSGNGYVSVTVGPTGVVEDVDADGEWLGAAREHFLEAALEEAFREATHIDEGDPR